MPGAQRDTEADRPAPRRRAAACAAAVAVACSVWALVAAGPAAAQTKPRDGGEQAYSPPGYAGVGVFDMPGLAAAEAQVVRRYRSGDELGAASEIDGLIARHVGAYQLHMLRAELRAATDDRAGAIAGLERAVDLGFRDLFGVLAKPPLNRIANAPEVAALAARVHPAEAARPPTVGRIAGGAATVGPGNTRWDTETRSLVTYFAFPKTLSRLPLYSLPPEGSLASLVQLVRSGLAAGNVGDLYDNRDDGHSSLRFDPRQPTQLTHIRYAPEARQAGIHYGLNTSILFDAIVLGNSSTALKGPNWRSQARFALTAADGPGRLWQLYANNHIYVFPGVTDFATEASGWKGDVFPAYTPYVVVSDGASGSDRPFLEAIQAILAAFRPETKAFLKERKLIAPAVQQILRRSQRIAPDRDAYMGPAAHPVVFRADRLDLAAAIGAANSMKADRVPPMATIRMLEEPHLASGVSFFADGLNEAQFDTPSAVARAWRGVEPVRRYVLAAAAEDPNGRPVKFHWRILRGDPSAIRIKPREVDGSVAEVIVAWQERAPTPERPDVPSHRVDIAAFADNGAYLSAPAVFSLAFPSHQRRVYAKGPGGMRIESIDYRPMRPQLYADPLLWPLRDWRDDYAYDGAGKLVGWSRTRKSLVTRFRADGQRLIENGRTVKVAYPLKQRTNPHIRNLYVEEQVVQ